MNEDVIVGIITLILVVVIIAFVIKQANRKHVPPRFPLLEEEIIIFESDAVWLKSTFGNKIGRMYLTNLRLVFSANPNVLFMVLFGLLGFLLAKLFTKKKPAFEINVKDIKTVQRTKYGLNKNVLDITDLTSTYRVSAAKKFMEPWQNELAKHATILPQSF